MNAKLTSFTVEFWFSGATKGTGKRLRILTFSMAVKESEFKSVQIPEMSLICSSHITDQEIRKWRGKYL